jgi:Cu+-exporting ATPase
MEKKDICVGDMECAACSASVERVLKKLDGMQNVAVNLATEKAHVEYDPQKLSLDKIEQTIKKAGFSVIEDEAEQKEVTGHKNALPENPSVDRHRDFHSVDAVLHGA